MLDGKITISRPCFGDGRELMTIRVKDGLSNERFLEVQIGLAEFTQAITGMGEVPAKLIIQGLDRVGLKKQRERRKVEAPFKYANKEKLTNWLVDNCQEEGWILDTYLGSQDSIGFTDTGVLLRYSVYRFVRPDIKLEGE